MAGETSALSDALTTVGDRWSLLVVDALEGGASRFAELQEAVPGIATNVLSQRLRRLEAGRVVVAEPYSRRPVRYSYRLTEAGRELAAASRLLAQWSADHGAAAASPPVHQACGAHLAVRWWCPTCDVPVEAGRWEAGVGGGETIWI